MLTKKPFCKLKLFSLCKKLKAKKVLLFVAGLILLLLGIFLGDAELQYKKSIFICLECIGIG